MSKDDRSWLDRVKGWVHKDGRDPCRKERYRTMVREWAEATVRDPRRVPVTVRESYQRMGLGDENVEHFVRMHDRCRPKGKLIQFDGVRAKGKVIQFDNAEVPAVEPIPITAHPTTPLNEKYAILAAIHDVFCPCDAQFNPWAQPLDTNLSNKAKVHEYELAECYYELKQAARQMTDAYQKDIERLLAVVSADLEKHCGGEAATHGPDFRDVTWYGKKHVFTPKQAACIRVLWEAWEQGNPWVADGTVLQKAGAGDKQRLRDVFKNHAAWGTMILKGSQQDLHGLQEILKKI